MNAFKLVLLIAVLVAIAIVYNWSMLDNLIIALVALLVVAWLWSRGSLNRLGLRRTLTSDRIRAGEVIEEELELTNHSWMPHLWIEVQDHSTLPDHHAGSVVSVGGRATSTWRSQTRVLRRGVYRLGPFTLHGGDPFGIFEKRRLIPVSHELVVYPAPIDVSSIPLPVAGMSGGTVRQGNIALSSPTIAGVREYAPGDPLNHVSWSATARRGVVMVKEFEPDPTADLWLVLDLSERGQFNLEGRPTHGRPGALAESLLDTTAEYIVSIGGSLAEKALAEGRKVGIVINRSMPIRLDADNSQRQWFRVFEMLASATAFGNRSLAEALAVDARRFSSAKGLVVVTSDPETDWAPAARALAERRVSVSAVVVDAGGEGDDSVTPLIEALAAARVGVTRFPTHTAKAHHVEPFHVHAT
ncbi:MAG TPA: DUF58 domain-containing protein [Thermomicrobiales bacterium]|nr:DUF58 domain-containing protein [Thermomicrobiales bacterium]